MKLGCVLMASGAAVRFGSNKLLTQLEGKPLFRYAMETYSAVPFDRRVVVSRYAEILEAAPQYGFVPLPNSEAQEGVAASVRLGTLASGPMDGLLFAVCDQPWLTPASVERLLDAFRQNPHKICSLAWEGNRGNPAIFPKELFGELTTLSGDAGGGKVIRRHPELLLLVPAHRAHELSDVDTPEDLNA